jgi:UDPglucose--hexose-1-phosphate uridylyltransferase
MFTVREIPAGKGILQYREETLTGLRCRISPERLRRQIDNSFSLPDEQADCPFCPSSLPLVTPLFDDGTRVHVGESVTFPNLFPFSAFHTVTVITHAHAPVQFTSSQLKDAFVGQIQTLRRSDGFPSINWNYLPSSGASLQHPHLQGIADRRPGTTAERYILGSEQYLIRNGCSYWDVLREQEAQGERYLFGDEIIWAAQAVPLGEREVRGYLPVADPESLESYLDPLVSGILRVLGLYRQLGTYAFNMGIFFARPGQHHGFSAFCSLISRINPNRSSVSDSSFMERLHLEPVILTLPEDLGRFYREQKILP